MTLEEVLELSEAETVKLEELTGSIYGRLKRKGICCECFHQKRLNDARKNGKELPFEPYENTLVHGDHEVIEKLRGILQSNFRFQKSRIDGLESCDAFHLQSGGIKHPFSITFYYVTKEEEQRFLLGLIDDFFEKIPQKQRKVSFYESENWIVKTHSNGTSGHRGAQKLLLEKIIK